MQTNQLPQEISSTEFVFADESSEKNRPQSSKERDEQTD